MVRVRHYTRVSAADKIMGEHRIIAKDRHRVFVELASSRKLSPRLAETRYDLKPGKGNAYVEFDVEPESLESTPNRRIGGFEYSIVGDIDLTERRPQSFANVF